MRYVITLEVSDPNAPEYEQLRATLTEIGAVPILSNTWAVNWGKRTHTWRILAKLRSHLADADRAFVVCLDGPEWYGHELMADLDSLKAPTNTAGPAGAEQPEPVA